MIKRYRYFNESFEFPSTEEEIKKVGFKFYNKIGDFTINDDMSIDVNGSVALDGSNLSKVPLKFNKVNGYFRISNNGLNSLDGCPKEVYDTFNCSFNNIGSLINGPIIVHGNYYCGSNRIDSFEGIPRFIGVDIYCQHNNIKSFKGIPEDFNGKLYCYGNPIHDIYRLFHDSKSIYWLNEYDVIQGNNVIMDRLEEVFVQLGLDMHSINKSSFIHHNLI